MEKQQRFNGTPLLWMVLLAIMPLLGACEKEEGMDENGIVSLSSIPKKPEYAKLPLIGTKWQLVGYANAKTGRIKKAVEIPDRKDTFTLTFNDDRTFGGRDVANGFGGKYELFTEDPNKVSVVGHIITTFIGEKYVQEVEEYINALYTMYKFDITSFGLALYYESDGYLLFRPIME